MVLQVFLLLACVAPSFAWYWCWTIDFDDLKHGTIVSDQYAMDYGVYIEGAGPLIAYDSSSPSINRLGTPNNDFGGEGAGAGGGLLGQGLNTLPQWNVLVAQQQTEMAQSSATYTPNIFNFTFALPITVTSLQMLDTGSGGDLIGYDSDGKMYTQKLNGWGDNSLQNIHCGWNKIIKITVKFNDHGCIASITFCIGTGEKVNGGWCDWSTCNAPTCGTGTQKRECKCPAPANGGKDCEGQSSRSCNGTCPATGTWGPWSNCTVPCGGGTQNRTCTKGPQGQPCPDGPSSQPCNTFPCPAPGNWSDWTNCSAPCGGGTQTRYCNPGPNGEACVPPGPTEQNCNTQPCPVNGGWGDWYPTPCGPCPATQFRDCNNPPPSNGGLNCTGNSTRPCDCSGYPVDGGWSDYSNCTFSSQYLACIKIRTCTNPPPANGGLQCVGPSWALCNDTESAASSCSTPCTPAPNQPPLCQNNGVCNVTSNNTWVCICAPGYVGATCTFCSDPPATCGITSDQTTVFRSLNVTFSSTINNNSTCQPVTGWESQWSYKWSVFNDSGGQDVSNLFPNNSYGTFFIAPYILTYPDQFDVTLTIIPPAGSKQNVSQCQTTVLVSGSPPTVTYTPPFIDLACSNPIVFNATQSYDTDNPGDTSKLTYLWQCSPLDSATCPIEFLGPGATQPVFTIDPTSFSSAGNLNITLTVGTTDGRGSTSIGTKINVGNSQTCPTDVTLVTCTKHVIGRNTSLECQGDVETTVPQPFLGALSASKTYQWKWEGFTSDGIPIDLSSRTSAANSNYLKIPGGFLPPGPCYFKLTAFIPGTPTSVTGQTEIITVADTAPYSLSATPLTVSPARGFAFSTQFTVQCHGWGTDLENGRTTALNYTFSYIDSTGREILLSGERSSPLVFAYFPVGTFKLIAKVEFEGSITVTTQEVSVISESSPNMALMPTECVVSEIIGSQLQLTLFEQDPHENMQLILGLSNYLNFETHTDNAVYCDPQEMLIAFSSNDPVQVSRSKLNDQLISTYLLVSNATYSATTQMPNATALQFAQTMTTLLRNTEWSGLSIDYLDQLQEQLTILIAQNNYGSVTLGNELMASISSLLRHSMNISDCVRIQSLIPLMHSVLSGVGSQTLPGEVPFQLTPDSTISSSGQRPLPNRDFTLKLNSIEMTITQGSLNALPTQNVEAHIVQLPASVFDSCHAIAQIGVAQTTQNELANGKLISDVVDISLYDYEGIEITVDSDSNVFSFSTAASPETCDVPQGDTSVSCVWFDESIGGWTTEGCSATTVYTSSVNCACNHMTQFSVVQAPNSCESSTIFIPLTIFWGLALLCVIIRAALFSTRVSGWGAQHRVADAISLPAALGLCSLFGFTFLLRLLLAISFLGTFSLTILELNSIGVLSLCLFTLSFALVVFEAYRSYARFLSNETKRYFSQRARLVVASLFFLLLGECLVWGRASDLRIICGVWGILDAIYVVILTVLSRSPPQAKPSEVDIANVSQSSPLVKPLISEKDPDGFLLPVSDQ